MTDSDSVNSANRKFHFTIPMKMPGNDKTTTSYITVEATNLTDAVESMQRKWNEHVEVHEYSVKELPLKEAGKSQ